MTFRACFESIFRVLLHVLAEWEDALLDPAKPTRRCGFFRRQELKRLGVSHADDLCTRTGLRILNKGGLVLGNRVALGYKARIMAYAKVVIEDDFTSAGDLIINSGNHDPDTLAPFARPVRIGRRVWCGERVTILSGVDIGDDAVLAAGAVVNRSVAPGEIVGGVPARTLGQVQRLPDTTVWSAFTS